MRAKNIKMENSKKNPLTVIACGGSGGHFYPGLSVARKLYNAGCDIILVVTEKEVDQVVTGAEHGIRVERMPAVGFSKEHFFRFFINFFKSYRKARRLFASEHPGAVLGMGGFSSAPTVLAAPKKNCKSFIHEGNSIPGRANRLVAPFVHTCFIHFPDSASMLRSHRKLVTGMPVRDVFVPMNDDGVRGCRMALGLNPDLPTLLVMGGSQGARAINHIMRDSLKKLKKKMPTLQIIHLTGKNDYAEIKKSYETKGIQALVKEYFSEMELAMGAATLIVSRSGASSLAESATMGVPSILIPLPSAADNHQYFNAAAFEKTGAAVLLKQDTLTPDIFTGKVIELLRDGKRRLAMKKALSEWHEQEAAETVARQIIEAAFPDAGLNTDWSSEPIL